LSVISGEPVYRVYYRVVLQKTKYIKGDFSSIRDRCLICQSFCEVMCYKKDSRHPVFSAKQKITAGSAIPDFGHEKYLMTGQAGK